MKDFPKKNIVILGNGISGITAARHLRKRTDRPITIISEEHPYFFSRTALMYVYMGHMPFEATQPYENDFWKKNNLNCIQASVKNINGQKKYLEFKNGETMSFDVLIIASGSKPNQLSCPGNDLDGVHGMYHKQDLDRLESLSHSIKSAVIVGGGLIGIELAEMLHSRGKKVTLIVRENSFWNRVLPDAESKMINSHIEAHGIRLLLETELKAINPSEQGGVKEVITNKGEVIPCEYVGSTIGVSPNVDFLKDSGITLGRGVLVNSFLETNLPDIYAIGDCAEQTQPQINRRPIEAVWYTGRIMGETLANTLCGKREQYQPNHWFNSAKFFDIEYQTYGRVEAEPDPKDQKQFYWQHQSKNQLLRLSYHPETEILQGVNVMGIRMRHKIFEQWLDQNKTLEEVIDSLQEAYFDPEFSKNPIAKIKADFALIKQ